MDDDGGLFRITLSDDDEKSPSRARRTTQSETSFQSVKKTYSARVENGDIFKSIKLHVPPNANKILLQQLLHAVEELYFFRRYRHAVDLIHDIFAANPVDAPGGLDHETRHLLSVYESRCSQKLES